ncbi:MAG: DNA polymerase II [Ignavibacterium sp.]|nr:DNA polymerase II [Ignavibacterium sp.]MCX7612493.1 DNA polymerase II [Ignavibacterium sp.]MDW8374439.1 DNA polymerase II [Ignavibacteriales bacterium]
MSEITTEIFILTGECFDFQQKNCLRFYGTSKDLGAVEVLLTNHKPLFFIERNTTLYGLDKKYIRKEVNLKNFAGKPVDALYFETLKDYRKTLSEIKELGYKTYESDVDPVRRFLMERFINAQMRVIGKYEKTNEIVSFKNPKIEPCETNPDFVIMSLDIETSSKGNLLYSIAIHVTGRKGEIKKVFILGQPNKKSPAHIFFFEDERSLLLSFFDLIREIDPDIIIGWHIIGFDLLFLENKCKELNLNFYIGRKDGKVIIKKREPKGYFAFVQGRVVIDVPTTLRMSFYNFEDYRLETVAKELLGVGKTITSDQNKVKEIERFFSEDKLKLAEYNLQDTVLVSEIINKTKLIDQLVKRAQLSGLLIDNLGLMTAAFDHFFLPRLHRYGYVAPDVDDIEINEHAAGGYVIEPTPGIYENVSVFDFKSLYPSIIQTFKIDPLSRLLNNIDTIKTPEGFKFSSSQHFLPGFINSLMKQREIAKKNKDDALSQAIKILMNSFYGVMGSSNCRFYHPDLPTAITSTGKYLLLESKSYLESLGYKVVYGDTDSLFVIMIDSYSGNSQEKAGEELAKKLNEFWKNELKNKFNAESFLEIEFEKNYKKFIITPARGSSEYGAKKRYAGLLLKNGKEEIEFVGLEFVRSDWTKLAKEFQTELYRRIFNQDEIENWIRNLIKDLKSGKFDDKLIYKKRLRKNLDEYVKNIPPHVRAAKLLNEAQDVVYYVITKRGPIPIQFRHDDIDYEHYIEKQLKPIADSVLTFLGKSFDNIVSKNQLSIFDL